MALVERKIHGFKMLLDTADPGQSAELLEFGTREGNAPELLNLVVKKGWTCIDMGASIGFYVLVEARAGADKIYAIEANPDNVKILKQNVRLNRFNVRVFNFAAGNKNGKARFMQHEKTNRGFMVDMVAHRPGGKGIVEIEERTIDSFVAEQGIENIDLLRFDIDGYEREMVEGARETIAGMPVRSWIFAELHPRCFDNPMKDLRPALDYIISCGFVPRKGVGPGKELAKVPPADFARACCEEFAHTAPLVFLEKRPCG